jgi:hypothetical protein
MEDRRPLQKKKTPSVPPPDEMLREPPESGKFGAVFYHPAQNLNLVLLKLNGTAISRNEHRIIGTIKTIRKKN